MKRRNVIVFAALVMLVRGPTGAAETLSRGHQVLLDRGLQVEAIVFTSLTGNFNLPRWNESDFSTIDFGGGQRYPSAFVPQGAKSISWSRLIRENADGSYNQDLVLPQESPFIPNLVRLQIGNEQDITDPNILAAIGASMSSFQTKYPHVITHTVQAGGAHTVAQMRDYMQQLQPDLLMFDTYPFNGNLVGGSPKIFYEHLEVYRELGLEGNDGTGDQPIPVGAYLQTFTYPGLNSHVVSDSENRLNNFAAWAFGVKLVNSYIYEKNPLNSEETAVLFSGSGTTNPTPLFYQVAETNRQSLNLGSALVRLISTDVQMLMGLHKGGFMSQFDVPNAPPNGVPSWTAENSAVPYLTGVAAENLDSLNNGLRGDVIVGAFKPLDGSFTSPGHEDDVYFMIVNALTDENGTAGESRQRIRLNLDFGDSGIDSLLRLSRFTGEVEEVSLIHDMGSQYHFNLELDGGTGDLFKFDNGGLFVGTDLLTGDLNTDGFVGQDDLSIILACWGTNVIEPGNWMQGDPSGDGFVGQDDLNAVLSGWGHSTPAGGLSAVPEAGGWTLLITALLTVFSLRAVPTSRFTFLKMNDGVLDHLERHRRPITTQTIGEVIARAAAHRSWTDARRI